MEQGTDTPFSLSFLGLGLSSDSSLPSRQLPPPPPCIEVHLSEISEQLDPHLESVVINDQVTLLKGRVNTADVFGLSDSDVVPGKYEGGLKLWEGAIDLVKCLYSEILDGRLSLSGKRVLELGCGHGLPGIYACLQEAAIVHFQDFNAECLNRQNGVLYMAGKKHYFGVGGGTRQFVHIVNEDGVMQGSLLSEVADGSSNVREIWKLTFRPG